ncbi:TM0996/MTH895 family glutaredoxin-like protein [Prosthecochloris sp. N3]|uniref:TM0996/MTH895 family glutaredoxin-like protein n=1 Tax=Prosthecochloris ethylica TaxID=2743976 RepID=A0ABR9XST6_9CHLB|nr:MULTISPECIES: thioredoxin family protein [Prosthecochloris]MBF0585966.1 TM0996/MTH895 family glutaredoxin-like protein [Prosthecochloris ethylica]MBF0637029.1 TM0996/MTH895 family glutaredoxin-like protein [Prosthecochloris ethylica]NUK47266.1 TM0996/MTH895 family glutaredoxin-like protein [Prosthecochloris ethylica]RNA64064.1 thioredoxin family protein [Prosthecochloris sp. ZM_2]
MKNIKVLGTGCPTCKQLEKLVRQAVEETSTDATIEKVEEIQDIIAYNVMSTPALVIDEEVRTSGRVPSLDEIKQLVSS